MKVPLLWGTLGLVGGTLIASSSLMPVDDAPSRETTLPPRCKETLAAQTPLEKRVSLLEERLAHWEDLASRVPLLKADLGNTEDAEEFAGKRVAIGATTTGISARAADWYQLHALSLQFRSDKEGTRKELLASSYAEIAQRFGKPNWIHARHETALAGTNAPSRGLVAWSYKEESAGRTLRVTFDFLDGLLSDLDASEEFADE